MNLNNSYQNLMTKKVTCEKKIYIRENPGKLFMLALNHSGKQKTH